MMQCQMVYAKSGSVDEFPCGNRATTECELCHKKLCYPCASDCHCGATLCSVPCLAEHALECRKASEVEQAIIQRYAS